MQYIALIHKNGDSTPTAAEWDHFIKVATETGIFKGGSAIGARLGIGKKDVVDTTEHVGGYMRFDTDNPHQLHELLKDHPVIRNGGTIELCEMPTT